MWRILGRLILKFRGVLLLSVIALTALMGYYASKVTMKYDLSSAIPKNNPKYIEHQEFKKLFGEDGNMMVVGFDNPNAWNGTFFDAYTRWQEELKKVDGVTNILSIPSAVSIYKQENDSGQKLITKPVFSSSKNFDSSVNEFKQLIFYRNLLYNPTTHSFLTAIYLDHERIRTVERIRIVNNIKACSEQFASKQSLSIHYSGLPFIRSEFAETLKAEMRLILIASLVLTTIILFLFFRSLGSVALSVSVVIAGVVWALGILYLCGYKISILTSLVAPLVVVIGIPNCIYFLNKYHTQYAFINNKQQALENMIDRMGVVTLFTNLTAAIGFGVFYFTKSDVLREFGLVAGLSILVVFVISLITIPTVLSYMNEPQNKHTKYLENKFLTGVLVKLDHWVIHHRKTVVISTLVVVAVSVVGLLKLKTRTFIVDDLPKKNKIYTDLKYFENRFHGVLPLEIMIDTKKKNGTSTLPTLQKLDELSSALQEHSQFSKPLSIVEIIKFARQAYYDGDSNSYGVPNSFDISFLMPYLKMKTGRTKSPFDALITSFVDSSKQRTRISVGVADVGSVELPKLLDSIKQKTYSIFDSTRYDVKFTGNSITFLEGSYFIINSLKESLLLALLMIVVCMFILFRNWRIVLISIVTNIIPLLITAGVMGFMNIPLKPSTVLVFSIALGIAIDVTIRFLVNYKQDLNEEPDEEETIVRKTIQETGISIIYTSLILVAGFAVFLVSQFDGTKSLGFLTALTLLLAMVTNLTILPAMLVWTKKKLSSKAG